MTDAELVQELLELAEWADANEWEVPIMLGDVLRMAAERLNMKGVNDNGRSEK